MWGNMVKKRYTAEEWADFRAFPPASIALGRKNRNNNIPRNANPFEASDPRYNGWLRGWDKRDSELLPKG